MFFSRKWVLLNKINQSKMAKTKARLNITFDRELRYGRILENRLKKEGVSFSEYLEKLVRIDLKIK